MGINTCVAGYPWHPYEEGWRFLFYHHANSEKIISIQGFFFFFFFCGRLTCLEHLCNGSSSKEYSKMELTQVYTADYLFDIRAEGT